MDIQLARLIDAALLIGIRVSGLMLFAPFYGSVVIPPMIKAGLVIAITAVLFPVYSPHVEAFSISQWPMVVGSELVVGIAMGIATNLVFDAAQLAGQVLSVQMGYSLVNILDPQTQVDTTVVAVFHQTIAMLIFLQLDVHHWILRGIGHSFEYLPPGTASLNAGFVTALMHGAASVFEVGIQIAAPVLAATLLADIVLGFLGKASPQMPLMLLGPALKSLLGLTIMGAALHYWPSLFEKQFASSIQFSEKLLHLAH
jgi:flagellar biosynthetic protein FliR